MHVQDLTTEDPSPKDPKHLRVQEVAGRDVRTRLGVGLQRLIDSEPCGGEGARKACFPCECLDADTLVKDALRQRTLHLRTA